MPASSTPLCGACALSTLSDEWLPQFQPSERMQPLIKVCQMLLQSAVRFKGDNSVWLWNDTVVVSAPASRKGRGPVGDAAAFSLLSACMGFQPVFHQKMNVPLGI